MPWILPDPPLPPPPPVIVGGAGSGATPGLAPVQQPIITPGGIDPYGCDLAMDPSGDLVVTHSGELATVTGPYNCAQAITMRLTTSPGEVPLHPEYGSILAGQEIGAKQDPQALASQLNADLQQMLREDLRFASAGVVQIQVPGNDSIQLGVQARLAGGEQLALGSVSDPSPVDVTLPQFIDPSVDPTLTYDPTAQAEFFADTPELDTLTDLNVQQSLIGDQPGTSILGTPGG